ncbi:PREDICTED: apolipoprotein C-III [Myotis davidii]|uniref:apolipoprotein C-III n=1 Tax=Myotis davidii TaxID=225400 RepID=UPI0003EC0059|nr:PREDICTED: apolipoprotein C-III [Myotis davidii]
MQPRALLLAALLVLLASARAQEADDSSLLDFMKGYMQEAQEALTSVKDLLAIENGSNWMEQRFYSLTGFWSTLTNHLSSFWPLAPGAAPGTTPAPAV